MAKIGDGLGCALGRDDELFARGKPLSHLRLPNLNHAGLIYYGLTPLYEAGSVLALLGSKQLVHG